MINPFTSHQLIAFLTIQALIYIIRMLAINTTFFLYVHLFSFYFHTFSVCKITFVQVFKTEWEISN